MPAKHTKPDTTAEASKALRPLIREIMRAAPERKFSSAALLAQIQLIIPDATAEAAAAALLWNQAKGNVDYTHDGERELDLWHLTTRGKFEA